MNGDHLRDEVFGGLAIGVVGLVVGIILALSQVKNSMDAEPVSRSALTGAIVTLGVALAGFGSSFSSWIRMGKSPRHYLGRGALALIGAVLIYALILQPVLDAWAGTCLPPWSEATRDVCEL